MNSLQVAFPGQRHVVLPVIHAESAEQSLRNAQISRDAGTDAIFLINHSILTEELLQIAAEVRKRFGAWWIGIKGSGDHQRPGHRTGRSLWKDCAAQIRARHPPPRHRQRHHRGKRPGISPGGRLFSGRDRYQPNFYGLFTGPDPSPGENRSGIPRLVISPKQPVPPRNPRFP